MVQTILLVIATGAAAWTLWASRKDRRDAARERLAEARLRRLETIAERVIGAGMAGERRSLKDLGQPHHLVDHVTACRRLEAVRSLTGTELPATRGLATSDHGASSGRETQAAYPAALEEIRAEIDKARERLENELGESAADSDAEERS